MSNLTTIEKVAKVRAAVEGGSTVADALKTVGISSPTYYKAIRKTKKAKRKVKAKGKALAPALLTVPTAEALAANVTEESVTIALIKCSRETAIKILKGY